MAKFAIQFEQQTESGPLYLAGASLGVLPARCAWNGHVRNAIRFESKQEAALFWLVFDRHFPGESPNVDIVELPEEA